jgi:hypothetical protein
MSDGIKPNGDAPATDVQMITGLKIESGTITRTTTMPIISRDLADFGTPGVWIEVDPDIAEEMGAFEETAVSLADAEDDGHGN